MSISTIMTQIQSLSAADKLLLNQQLASCMVGQSTKATSKASSRKGKPAAAGTLAWTGFVAHVVKTMPERFAPPALPKERLSIAAAIRLENPEAYKTFCEDFKATMPARDSDSESVVESVASAPSTVSAPSDKPKRVISEEQKAKMKAGREAAAAAKANGTYVPKVKAEKAVKEPKVKAEKAVKEPKVKAAKAKKVAKAEPVASADAVQVDSNLEKVTVDGITYWLNTANNNLYDLEGEGMGAFAGAYMPGNEEGEMVDFEATEA